LQAGKEFSMRSVVQRVSEASLTIDGTVRAAVPPPLGGLVVLVGLEETDTSVERVWMAQKIAHLRIFPDVEGRMNLSVLDTCGTVMLVPNFTVVGEAQRGRRPSFDRAMKPPMAAEEFSRLIDAVRSLCPRVTHGVFQADMKVSLVNEGPVTIILASPSTTHGDG